jgi:hypothetical protein
VEPTELLHHVSSVLEKLAVPYVVVGSVASSYYGEPRLTNDVDVVADLSANDIAPFLREFPDDQFYVSESAVRQAVQTRAQFNIIHPESGLKADIVIPSLSAFDVSRLRRRIRVKPFGSNFDAYFASPEDVILKKMEFYHEGGSEKHLRDIAGMLKIRGEQVDRSYISEWAQKLGLEDVWRRIQ